MPSLHFTSPYGHVKPQLLQALSIKRKKSRVAAVAAAAVFKVFTNTRGRDAIIRQGVKYRNMFHAGGGLVRERQPGEEVTPEKGWVTDEDSEHSEAEGSEEEVIPVVVEAEDMGKFDADQMTMEEEAEALVMAAEESAMDLIHEAEEVANTDLLKLEISLAEKEIPQVPVPEASIIHAEEEVVEAEVLSAQEPTSERLILEEVNQQLPELLVVDVEEQAPEQFIVSLEQAQEQEPATEVDAVLVTPEPQLEHVLEPSHPQPLSLASAMSLLEPTEREPLTLTTVMSVLQPLMLQPFTPTEIADVQQPDLILEVKEVEASLFDHIPEEMQVEMQVEQEDMKADDTEQQAEAEVQEALVEQEDMKADDTEQQAEAEIQEALVEQEDMKADDTEQQTEAEMQEALVEEVDTLLEKSSLEDEVVDTIPNQTIEREPEVQESAPIIQPTHLPSIAVPTLEVQGLKEEIVEKVIPLCVEVISPQPPQETLVLAVSEKHSEQLFDDGVCEYEETELSEDEEPEAELENLELEGSLESTPSHLFKLTLPMSLSTNSPSPATVALGVKPEQTLLDLQKLIQLELLHTSIGSQHISFTTLGAGPPDHTTDIVSKPDSTGFAIKDGESAILRRPSYSDPSKHGSKPACTPTRWSLSTEIGTFIGDASKSQYFTIGISHTPDKPPSTTIRISLPSFNDRTLHLRSQLRILTPNLSSLSALKSECDVAVQRTTQKRSILTLAMSGFACLLLPLLLITFAYLSQPGLFPSFRNTPPGELRLPHPVTTYIMAGLADILLLAGFAYLWSVYRSTGRHSVPDLATVKGVYSERGFDVAKWEELQAENTRLRSEIRRVAAEYDVSWDDDEVEQTKAAATAA